MNPLIVAEGSSQKDRIMALLVDRALGHREVADPIPDRRKAVYRGWTNIDVPGLQKALGIPAHDVTHALYDLRNQGRVTFRESKRPTKGRSAGDNGIPVGIRVPIPVLERWEEDKARDIAYVKSRLDPATTGTGAFDHRRLVGPASDQAVAKGIADDILSEGIVADLQDLQDHLREVVPEAIPGTTLVVGPPPEAIAPDDMPAVLVGPRRQDHPAVSALVTREHRRMRAQEAAKMLEDIGLDDQALDVLAAFPDISELEQDVLHLAYRLGWTDA